MQFVAAASVSDMRIVLTCSMAGSDPEDLYDCKLSPGYTLDGAVRVMMRQLRDAQDQHEKDVRYEMELIGKWRKSILDIQKALHGKAIPQDDKSKS